MKLEFAFSHGLDLATLQQRLEARVAHYAARYPHLDLRAHFQWNGEREVRGSYRGGAGVVTLGEREVRVALELPFLARAFKSRIEDFVRRELAQSLAA